MVVLRKMGAVLLLVMGVLIGLYGILSLVQCVKSAIDSNSAYSLVWVLGGLSIASIGYSVGALGVILWRRA